MQRIARLFTVTALTLCGLLAVSLPASAQYVAPSVEPVGLFDWAAMGTAVLTIMGSALAAVGLYKISVGIGKKVIAYFGGRA
jgi:hypothetical protein